MDIIKSFNLTQWTLAVTPMAGGLISAFQTRTEVKGVWYKSLARPWWQPPAFVFPVVWNTIYACLGYSAVRVYNQAGLTMSLPWTLYGSMLALNWSWSPLFFTHHRIGLALGSCTLQWFLTFACIREFGRLDTHANWGLLPLQLWLTVATALNFNIWQNNPDHDGAGPFQSK
eukprot:m.100611 g.100611  ORF g.100611 m.100611 type:complete len:172 (-) comp15134_c0_seq2:1201-1716(-)